MEVYVQAAFKKLWSGFERACERAARGSPSSPSFRHNPPNSHVHLICPRRIASHYYVNYHTIATFNEHLKPTMADIELLRLFALADEFKYMIVREVSHGWGQA